jgi:hypothetical protein
MKRLILTAGLVAASFAVQPAASAATFTITYLGTIADNGGTGTGYDPDNFFGTGDVSLTGQAVKAIFTFTSTGALNYSSTPSLSGVDGFGISSAKIIVNGVTQQIFGTNGGFTTIKNDLPTDRINQYVQQANSYGDSQDYSVAGTKFDAGVNIDPGTTSFLSTASFGQNGVYFPTGDSTGHFTFINSSGVGDAFPLVQGFYNISAISVAAVPEPATWAMMVLGLAGVGASLRRRRRAQPQGGLVPAAV